MPIFKSRAYVFGFPLFLILFVGIASCKPGPAAANANLPGPAPNSPATAPLATPATIAPKATPNFSTSLKSGEPANFQRQLLRQDPQQKSILPQDYTAGELLQVAAEHAIRVKAAEKCIRDFFKALRQQESTDVFCSQSARKFVKAIFGPYQKEITALKAIRFLKNYRLDDNQSAFEINLIGQNSNARLQIYLRSQKPDAAWLISDIQGNCAGLSQATETGYTDYEPTENDRQLILEGHVR